MEFYLHISIAFKYVLVYALEQLYLLFYDGIVTLDCVLSNSMINLQGIERGKSWCN